VSPAELGRFSRRPTIRDAGLEEHVLTRLKEMFLLQTALAFTPELLPNLINSRKENRPCSAETALKPL